MGEWGGQYTTNWGPEWTGIRATTQRRDFQVSKGGFPRGKGRDFQATKRGCQKGVWGMHLYVWYRVNKRLCLGYK